MFDIARRHMMEIADNEAVTPPYVFGIDHNCHTGVICVNRALILLVYIILFVQIRDFSLLFLWDLAVAIFCCY